MWSRSEALEPIIPETQTAPARCRPPSPPEAPPAASPTGGPLEEPGWAEQSLAAALETGLLLLRTISDLLASASEEAEPEWRAGVSAALAVARQSLCGLLDALCQRLAPGAVALCGTDLRSFKYDLLRLSQRPLPRDLLDAALRTRVFGEVARAEAVRLPAGFRPPEPHYRYPLPAGASFFRLGLLRPGEFARQILEDLRELASRPENYASAHRFDREVAQRFLALLYVSRNATAGEEGPPEDARPRRREDAAEGERRPRRADGGRP